MLSPHIENKREAMRIGIDIGGTFTDIVCVSDDGTVTSKKVSSTVDDYSRSISSALPGVLETLGEDGQVVKEVIHGTTVATNAILQGTGAATALITTKGFRDVLELRRIRMPELYNWNWDKPPDLVERSMRWEVLERINARGEIITPLDIEQAEQVIDEIASRGTQSIAICLINSYINSTHEEKLAELIRKKHPRLHVSVSSNILREAKEYERTATATINAYVLPLVKDYIESLSSSLKKIKINAPLMIMQSNGGVLTASACVKTPVYMIESGPAAGVIAAHALARTEGIPNAISFDMGGTTAKASIIEDGVISSASEYEVGSSLSLVSRLIKGGGHLIRVPAIDIAEVGAGGGSVAWLDTGGALHIGPRSAGASPGPVCYDQGGRSVTITDANLILGYINAEGLVGGGIKLNRAKAEESLQEQVGRPLGLEILEAAYGIHLLANSNMMRAVRSVSTERGRDVRDFSLIAFGGNGPIHACEMGRHLEMKEAVIPPYAGLFSAFGLLSADISYHQVQTYYRVTREVNLDELNSIFSRMEDEVFSLLEREGFAKNEIEVDRFSDLRYTGQCFELPIPGPEAPITRNSVERIESMFDEEHEKTYGHKAGSGEDYSFVNLRVVGKVRRTRPADVRVSGHEIDNKPKSRKAYFGEKNGLINTTVISRIDLGPTPQEGPLLIDEYDSTTVVPPGCQAWVDLHGNIRVHIGAEAV